MKKLSFVMLLTLLLTVMFGVTSNIQRARAVAQVILTHVGYLDALGYYHVVGEVQNTGDLAVNFFKITATFYDVNNIVVAIDFAYTLIDVLLSGRKAPFDIILLDTTQSAKVHHYSLSVTFSTTSPKPVGLEILSHSSYIDIIGWMHIVGEIKNIGTVKATFVKIVATFYNATGHVIGAEFTYSDPSDIEPGQKAPFEILLTSERVPYVKSYNLEAESTQYALIPDFPSALILTVFMVITMFAVILSKKKTMEKSNTNN